MQAEGAESFEALLGKGEPLFEHRRRGLVVTSAHLGPCRIECNDRIEACGCRPDLLRDGARRREVRARLIVALVPEVGHEALD